MKDSQLRPYSERFGEHYWSGGVAEKDFVFVQGNGLGERFAGAEEFCVGELGFGTGLNFLLAWRLWEQVGKGVLTFVSYEMFPLEVEELREIHGGFPGELKGLSALFLEAYGVVPGWNYFGFGKVRLRLFVGDAAVGLREQDEGVDAWFLDGFSPAVNGGMWEGDLLKRVGELTKGGGTATTYSVAAVVREGLKAAGFTVEKAAGFPPKRDMLKAVKL